MSEKGGYGRLFLWPNTTMNTPSFPYAHHAGSDWRSICDALLADLPDQAPGQLAFIYLSDALAADSDRIIDYLRSRTGVAHWVGSVAQGVCSTRREVYEEVSIAVMLTDLADEDFRVIPPIRENPEPFLETTIGWREQNLASVAIVHGDPSHNPVPQAIEQLADGLQGGFLIGGLSSSATLQVQIADKAVGAGLSGVLLSGRRALMSGLSQGCQLIGERHQITALKDNMVGELDHRPALDVLKDTCGVQDDEALAQLGGTLFAALPIAGSDTGDYLVRNLIGFDPDTRQIAIGDYPALDSSLQFARRDHDSAVADLKQMLEKLKARLPGPPKGALFHSCLGRGRHQFGDDSAEMKLIAEVFGDLPIVGFYANGEISHRRLYGYTGVLSIFC